METQREIAAALGVSQVTIHNDLDQNRSKRNETTREEEADLYQNRSNSDLSGQATIQRDLESNDSKQSSATKDERPELESNDSNYDLSGIRDLGQNLPKPELSGAEVAERNVRTNITPGTRRIVERVMDVFVS